MTEEQKHMWALLQYNPAYLTHKWAEELSAVRHDCTQLNQLADEFLYTIIKSFTLHDAGRVIKTWFATYNLPLDPSHLTAFDLFHDWCGRFIVDNVGSIIVFEKV